MAEALQSTPGLNLASSSSVELSAEPAPMTIKQILAQLDVDGVFPMDEAVTHGKRPVSHFPLVMN